MAGYTNKRWQCPFFRWDERLTIHGECGRIEFNDDEAANDYMDRYCADLCGWRGCSVSRSLLRYYERTN